MKKSERLNKELIYLSYRKEFHLKELENEFNISERTALRDIANLEELGLNFYVEKGRYGAYHLTQNRLWVPINFELEEINAIFFALKALNKMTTTPFSNAYNQIYHKLMKSLPTSRQENILKQQNALLNYIHGKTQTFITTTDLEGISWDIIKKPRVYHIQSGTISLEKEN